LQTYLFYDLETTGLNKAFDQVLHFAAIRTDLALNEINRYEIKVKLNPDAIPSPYALIIHKMGIKEILDGVPEFEAMKQIHEWMNEPGTISLGYNTLGFDDEFLRFSFYRNLLKPYTHQFANSCYRMDIYPMTVMFFLFKNSTLKWPQLEKQISLKLENLNNENDFVAGRSHHAMVDVEVTLEVARKFMQEREMWDYLHGYFKKNIDAERMQSLQKNIALLVSGKLGAKLQFQSSVLYLGNHTQYNNQSLWLRLDTDDMSDLSVENFIERTWCINKKAGEPNFILPYKDRFLKQLPAERIELAARNLEWLQRHPDLLETITQHYIQYIYPVFPETDAEARLYLDGFWTQEDNFFCQRFHHADVSGKARLTEQTGSKLKSLALRILGRHYPNALELYGADLFSQHLSRVSAKEVEKILIDFQGRKRLTPEMALLEIETIKNERALDAADTVLLDEYGEYLRETFC
jgi:exodeoxyribonuclease-1